MSVVRHVLFYDSDCSFCQFQMRVLARLDWFHKTDLIALKDFSKAELAAQIDEEELNEAIHCVTTKQKTYRGARAIRFLGMRMPLLVPLAMFMWIPGVMFFAEKIYNYISRNRYILSKILRCEGSCSIPAARKGSRSKHI